MTNSSIAPLIEEIERLSTPIMEWLLDSMKNDWWYRHCEDNVVPEPTIMISTKKLRVNEKDPEGWYTPAMWDSTTQQAIAALAGQGQTQNGEVVLTTNLVGKDVYEIMKAVTVQMIHHITYEKRNPKRSPTNVGYLPSPITLTQSGYYTNEFMNVASRLGFTLATGNKGWNLVSNTAKTKAAFDMMKPNHDIFDLHRKAEEAPEFTGSKLKKWMCDCTIVRVATFFEATCIHCGKEFEYVDHDVAERVANIASTVNNHQGYQWSGCNRYGPDNFKNNGRKKKR